jgi:hypothetical protein
VKRLKLLVVLNSVLSLEGDSLLRTFSLRIGNVHRDGAEILIWAAELDEKMFNRQFRLCRTDFFYVLVKISDDLSKNTKNDICSSGSPITLELMLLITLRILAGASYLDMIHYRVYIDSVASIARSYIRNVRQRPVVPDQEAVDDPMPSDEAILIRLHNTYIHSKALSTENSLRTKLLHSIYEAGIVTTSDTEFHILED